MMSTRHSASLTLALFLFLSSGIPAYAEEANEIRLVLEPHCAQENRSECPVFDVLDPEHLSTGTLKAGDILDIDVVLLGASGEAVTTIRSWLSYDSESLDVRSVTLSPVFTEPIPGEQSADATQSVVKIGGNTGDIRSDRTAIARVTFQVKTTGKNSIVSFSNYRDDGMGQTAVRGESTLNDKKGGLKPPPCLDELICRRDIVSLLHLEPSALAVIIEPLREAAVSDPIVATTVSAAEPESIVVPVLGNQDAPQPETAIEPANNQSSFSLLQVQNLRVTSRDSSIFLGWQPLQSSALRGYNVYYGTVSGRYIQRRTIPSTASSLVLRDLEPGTTYFIAVRGFNAENEETAFSQEVSVTVGDPESSTAPLIAELMETQPEPENIVDSLGGTEINGNTGVSTTIFILALLCALIGTGFAAHRQCMLASLLTHVG